MLKTRSECADTSLLISKESPQLCHTHLSDFKLVPKEHWILQKSPFWWQYSLPRELIPKVMTGKHLNALYTLYLIFPDHATQRIQRNSKSRLTYSCFNNFFFVLLIWTLKQFITINFLQFTHGKPGSLCTGQTNGRICVGSCQIHQRRRGISHTITKAYRSEGSYKRSKNRSSNFFLFSHSFEM